MAGKNKTSNEKSSKTGEKKPKTVKNKSNNNNEGDESSSSSKLKPATAINSRHILVRSSLSLYMLSTSFRPRTERVDLESKITLQYIVRETFKKRRSSSQITIRHQIRWSRPRILRRQGTPRYAKKAPIPTFLSFRRLFLFFSFLFFGVNGRRTKQKKKKAQLLVFSPINSPHPPSAHPNLIYVALSAADEGFCALWQNNRGKFRMESSRSVRCSIRKGCVWVGAEYGGEPKICRGEDGTWLSYYHGRGEAMSECSRKGN